MPVLEKTASSPAGAGDPPVSHPTTSSAPRSGHDGSDADDDAKYQEEGDAIYDRFSRGRKRAIVCVLGFGAFVALISSTSVLPAVPEITATFGTTDNVLEISNAIYIGLTGVGCVVWGPLSQLYGRRPVSCLPSVRL